MVDMYFQQPFPWELTVQLVSVTDQVLRFYSANFEDKGIIEVPLADLKFEKSTAGPTIQKGFFISCKKLGM